MTEKATCELDDNHHLGCLGYDVCKGHDIKKNLTYIKKNHDAHQASETRIDPPECHQASALCHSLSAHWLQHRSEESVLGCLPAVRMSMQPAHSNKKACHKRRVTKRRVTKSRCRRNYCYNLPAVARCPASAWVFVSQQDSNA